MKKLVCASAMALASICLVSTPALRAQDAGQISLPADQFNAYQSFSTQTDPTQKCAAGESFLQAYPQTQVKNSVLDAMIDCYQQTNQTDKILSTAGRLLQIDPNNPKAIFASVYVKKGLCGKSVDATTGVSSDPQTCDDAAALAQKGLTVPKPAGMSDADWTKFTGLAYPIFHSTLALDDIASKKDLKSAIEEYNKELMLYPPDQCTKPGQCLIDTLQLAQTYAKPGDTRDEVKAIWFYARAWDFAPAAYKAQIEPLLEYWYKRFHGTLDGDAAIKQQIAAIETQAQSTLFPPATYSIAPAPTPQELALHAFNSGDPTKLNLEDKEFILANGTKDIADKLWAILKDQPTPVPGIVVTDPANALRVSVTTAASVKPKDFVVKLTNPVACSAVPVPPSELRIKEAQAYLLANGVKADTDAMGDILTDSPAHLRKILIEPGVSAISVAVTEDAKATKVADFIVNMKEPLSCKEAPDAGATLALQPEAELDGTYDTYTQVPAAGSTEAAAQIVLRDGFFQPAKKAGPAHRPAKPSPSHHPAGM